MSFKGPAIPESYSQPRNNFEYPGVSLNANEIRTVIVRAGVYGDDILADLRLVTICSNDDSFDHCYEALSYTWGPWTQKRTIVLNGKSGFHVTDNIFNALQRLRLRHRPRRLWIDAICIDQDNISERNAQLQIMGKIYKNADHVLVWLGDGDDHHKPLEKHIAGLYKSSGGLSGAERRSLAHALLSTQPHWWDRVWVVQEFAMAVREPVILFGKYRMSYNEFEGKVEAFFKWENRRREQMADERFERWTKPIWEWINTLTCQLRERKDQQVTERSDYGNAQSGLLRVGAAHISDRLLSILQATEKALRPSHDMADPSILDRALDCLVYRMNVFDRYRHVGSRSLIDTAWRLRDLVATSPHDKIFGLLALMRPETARLLNPDYGSRISDVYALTTFAALREPGGEDFRALSLVTFGTERPERERPDWKKDIGQPRTSGLPSWAVDFAFPLADAVGSSVDP